MMVAVVMAVNFPNPESCLHGDDTFTALIPLFSSRSWIITRNKLSGFIETRMAFRTIKSAVTETSLSIISLCHGNDTSSEEFNEN
jgi:hypothetical protein